MRFTFICIHSSLCYFLSLFLSFVSCLLAVTINMYSCLYMINIFCVRYRAIEYYVRSLHILYGKFALQSEKIITQTYLSMQNILHIFCVVQFSKILLFFFNISITCFQKLNKGDIFLLFPKNREQNILKIVVYFFHIFVQSIDKAIINIYSKIHLLY